VTSPNAIMAADLELADDPIKPEWVLDGDPRARAVTWAVSPDQTTSHWLWECSSGSFRWWFGFDETVTIVEGEVHVEIEGQPVMHLGVGDSAYFPAGRWSTWTVPEYVRKQAVLRTPVPGFLARVARGLGYRKYANPTPV
jgi:uncharacterized cupin superfamily protein